VYGVPQRASAHLSAKKQILFGGIRALHRYALQISVLHNAIVSMGTSVACAEVTELVGGTAPDQHRLKNR
jgi:hypothetical protein